MRTQGRWFAAAVFPRRESRRWRAAELLGDHEITTAAVSTTDYYMVYSVGTITQGPAEVEHP